MAAFARNWAFFLFFAASCAGQTFGTISGEVKDASGAAVVGANVTARNVSTNVTRSERTNSDGVYAFAALLPGKYDVRVEMQGFRSETSRVSNSRCNRRRGSTSSWRWAKL